MSSSSTSNNNVVSGYNQNKRSLILLNKSLSNNIGVHQTTGAANYGSAFAAQRHNSTYDFFT